MTPTPKDILGQIAGGRVLDVATGTGGFIHFLIEGLKDYDEIIGVDNAERRAETFEEAFRDKPNIRFEVQDACHLDFADSAFDMVCISNSLHHLDPVAALREMKRVLRPDGFLLVSEMYRDDQTETQMTHVLLHHWWGAVDIVNGIAHRETYPRCEIIELVRDLDLEGEILYDLSDLDSDPKDPAILAELEPVFERYIQRAEGHPDLQQQGEQLRKRVEEIGFHSATTLLMIGRKR
ncbi:MAG TPA: class I SAM-dependent methyltransferase [Anaerolineales bacterium]|nr:class I SAM-dependent methyltransferase [Anaerolineales bacterium]